MMNQYGSIETTLDLGSFDFIDGVESVLRFFLNLQLMITTLYYELIN